MTNRTVALPDGTRIPAIGQGTYIGPRVKLGNNVRIGHNCTLDGEITIGDDTVIWNNVVMVNRVTVGSRCTICSGTVIGHDGFGFTEDAAHRKTMVRHFGGVHIGDDPLAHPGGRSVQRPHSLDGTVRPVAHLVQRRDVYPLDLRGIA